MESGGRGFWPQGRVWHPATLWKNFTDFIAIRFMPLYRRRGHSRHDAQDLTQDFFVHLLEKGTLSRADPERGRFRSFLLELEGRGDLFKSPQRISTGNGRHFLPANC